MVKKSGAHSTGLQNSENVRHLCSKFQNTSQKWAHTTDKLWEARLREKAGKPLEEVLC